MLKVVSYSIERPGMNKCHHRLAAWTVVKSAYIATRSRDACLAAALLVLSHFVALLSAPATQAATWTPYDLPKLQQTILRSAAGAPYRIVVATPTGKAPAGDYPVIYVVDGNAWTSLVSEIIRVDTNLGIQSRVEPAVVVGIGYPAAEAFDLGRRGLNFTSAATPGHPDPDVHPGLNGGDIALMNFIDDLVKPVIEERFPIDRTRQTLSAVRLAACSRLKPCTRDPGRSKLTSHSARRFGGTTARRCVRRGLSWRGPGVPPSCGFSCPWATRTVPYTHLCRARSIRRPQGVRGRRHDRRTGRR